MAGWGEGIPITLRSLGDFYFFFADEAGKGGEGEALIAGDGNALVVV